MTGPPPFWIAQREGQDWRDEDVLRAVAWLVGSVDAADWSRRIDAARATFVAAKREWAQMRTVPLFDPADAMAWYVFQANAYACDRGDFFEPEGFRIAPVFKRLGQLVDDLRRIPDVDDRVRRLMTSGRKQPDDGIYELLVAGAYLRRGWSDVRFVAERRGVAKTQDLLVTSGRRRFAVECKRVNRSGYEADERRRGESLAAPVHELCRRAGRSVIVEVVFTSELTHVADPYLVDKAEAFLRNPRHDVWDDEYGHGQIRNVDWSLARAVLEHDDVFFGSSRMIELLVGQYVPHVDHSVAADWMPAPERPLFATEIRQASVVSWASDSTDAANRKARHFRAMVAQGAQQLPGDCPGVVHVGYEAVDGNSVDHLRHVLNRMQVTTFDPGTSRLRWVYANYLSPEHTNDRNESAALSETTAVYKIRGHRINEPLPDHLLFSDYAGRPGDHWRR